MTLILQLKIIILITSVKKNAKECTDIHLPRMLQQLQNFRAERHSKFMNYQNEEVKSRKNKNRSMVTEVNLARKNILAEFTKRKQRRNKGQLKRMLKKNSLCY